MMINFKNLDEADWNLLFVIGLLILSTLVTMLLGGCAFDLAPTASVHHSYLAIP